MLTKDDWKSIDLRLKYLRNPVHLWIDGYKVSLVLLHISQFECAIVIYVNDLYKGKWSLEDCDIRRRFYCERKHFKFRKDIRVKFKKKTHFLGMTIEDLNSTWSFYSPYWKSFRALKNHLVKNNQSMEFYEEKRHGKITVTGTKDTGEIINEFKE